MIGHTPSRAVRMDARAFRRPLPLPHDDSSLSPYARSFVSLPSQTIAHIPLLLSHFGTKIPHFSLASTQYFMVICTGPLFGPPCGGYEQSHDQSAKHNEYPVAAISPGHWSLAASHCISNSNTAANRNRRNSFIQKEKTFSNSNKNALFPFNGINRSDRTTRQNQSPIFLLNYATGIRNPRNLLQTKEKTFSALR